MYVNGHCKLERDLFNGACRWRNSFFVPLIATVSSALLLISQALYRRLFQNAPEVISKPTAATNEGGDAAPSGIFAKAKALADLHGGLVIYSFKVVRVLGCVVLFGLSVISPLMRRGGPKDLKWDNLFSTEAYPEIALALTFVSGLSSQNCHLY